VVRQEVRRAYRRWHLRRYRLSTARYNARLAEERAKVHLAAYKVKADIEWDVRWMSPLDKTWRDELMVIVWALPVLALFLPYTRPWALEFFHSLKDFDKNGPAFYLGGWAILFSATFGIKQVRNMLPGRFSRLVSAMSAAPDDVPQDAAAAAQEAVAPSDPAAATPNDPQDSNKQGAS
jgi:hypothetical protein